jgi:hypothetical protein
MFIDQLRSAIADAKALARLQAISQQIWKAHGEGQVSDDGAQELAELLHERQQALKEEPGKPVGAIVARKSLFPPRRLIRPRVRAVCLARRRLLATSGPMPPQLAQRFTVGELAVLRIMADEVLQHGVCTLSLQEIADRAGTGRTLARNAIQLAERHDLLASRQRPVKGAKNMTNVVTIISREWLLWLARGTRIHPIGSRTITPSDNKAAREEREVVRLRHRAQRVGSWPRKPLEARLSAPAAKGKRIPRARCVD